MKKEGPTFSSKPPCSVRRPQSYIRFQAVAFKALRRSKGLVEISSMFREAGARPRALAAAGTRRRSGARVIDIR